MDHFRYIKIHTWLQTKEMYHSFLSLKMISFDFDDFFQASQPSTMNFNISALVYRDERNDAPCFRSLSLHKNMAKIAIFTKATGYYFRKGDYWSFD